jgi:hypothetical protein
MKGMRVSILVDKDTGDCTNGGITSRVKSCIVVGPGIPEIFEAGSGDVVLQLIPWFGYFKAVPIAFGIWGYWDLEKMIGPMFGGNYITTSDSRFKEVCPHPVPVHDRYETQEQYDRLSI